MARENAIGSENGWVQPIQNRRGFEIILDRLEAALLTGELAVGDRLPGEREMAAGFGISRTSVREAVRVLEALGVVEVRRGAEGASLRRQPGDVFADLLRLHLALGHYDRRSVIEFRTILESWAAAEAARRRDAILFAQLEDVVKRMASDTLDPVGFHALDVEFHESLIDASGNALAALALRGCRTVNRQAMLDGMAGGAWPDTRIELHRDHQALLDQIASGDADAAARAVKEHIEHWSLRTGTRSVTNQ
jgi:GntR family transcriptional regulator, transcriptional repressor for pyruvate dehydrogenase complex